MDEVILPASSFCFTASRFLTLIVYWWKTCFVPFCSDGVWMPGAARYFEYNCGIVPALCVIFIDMLELDADDRGLDLIEPAVEPDFIVVIAHLAAVVPQAQQMLR